MPQKKRNFKCLFQYKQDQNVLEQQLNHHVMKPGEKACIMSRKGRKIGHISVGNKYHSQPVGEKVSYRNIVHVIKESSRFLSHNRLNRDEVKEQTFEKRREKYKLVLTTNRQKGFTKRDLNDNNRLAKVKTTLAIWND